MNIRDFVAIDFEIMTPERTSACAVGLVVVLDGVITLKFYSLIRPIPDRQTKLNTDIHGITPEMVKDAPTFDMLFEQIRELIGDLPIVCHNRNMDINVLRDCMDYYHLTGIDVDNNICTYELTGLNLKACCAKYGINMGVHHDALDDATACAKVLLAHEGHVVPGPVVGLRQVLKDIDKRKFDRETLDPLTDDEVMDKSTPFFHASVVITGTFAAYPNRNELGLRLKALGADINTAVSGKPNIVGMGIGAGWSKIEKIEAYRAKGHDIRIIYEPELKEILEHGTD